MIRFLLPPCTKKEEKEKVASSTEEFAHILRRDVVRWAVDEEKFTRSRFAQMRMKLKDFFNRFGKQSDVDVQRT